MSSLLHSIGLPEHLGFSDIYSLTEPDLLSLVPRPSLALLLVFPVTASYESGRVAEDSQLPTYNSSGPQEPVTWFKQTIRNACGLIGLLHAAANGEVRGHVAEGSELDNLLREAEPLGPEERAELLYRSQALESAHATAAQEGDTQAPDKDENVDLHFVCFVKGKDGHLWELDGRRKGPLDRGALGADEDMLSETAIKNGVSKLIEREGGDLRFSLVSLGPVFD
jgi:hypothetical protein